jgi:aspartate aminotransferase
VPCWVSFTEQVKLAGATPVPVSTVDHQLDIDAIEAAVTRRTKIILINSPNNPTGALYPPETLAGVARLAVDHDLWILADEAYADYAYDGLRCFSILEAAQNPDRCMVVRSFSKSYSMTGFRVGYVAAAREIITALAALQSHLTGNVCTFAQHGALAALSLDTHLRQQWQSEMEKKRDIAYGYVASMFKCVKPRGAFYLFPDVSDYLQTNESAAQLAEWILDRAQVAVVPGEAFGVPRHLRISYGVSEGKLIEGLERLSALEWRR